VKGRRIAFALSLLLSFLTTALVFKFLRTTGQMYWMLPLMGFGQLSVFAVYAVYLPELFPTSLRSTGTSFCYNVGRIIAATAPFTISKITANLGADIESFRTAGLWVSLVLLLGIAVLPLMPATVDQPLPDYCRDAGEDATRDNQVGAPVLRRPGFRVRIRTDGLGSSPKPRALGDKCPYLIRSGRLFSRVSARRSGRVR